MTARLAVQVSCARTPVLVRSESPRFAGCGWSVRHTGPEGTAAVSCGTYMVQEETTNCASLHGRTELACARVSPQKQTGSNGGNHGECDGIVLD
jgi:hypothetical protein